MRKYILTLAALCLLYSSALAQTLAFDSHSMTYGYKNSDGSWKIAPQFQQAYDFQNGQKRFAVVKQDYRWGCIDVNGQMIVRNIFFTKEEATTAGKEWQSAEEPGKWIYPAENGTDRKWGFVNYYGQWKFSPIYEDARPFVGKAPMTFATVKMEGRWGCIDGKGILIINNIFLSQEDAEAAGKQWIFGTQYDIWRCPTTNPNTKKWGYVNYLGRWVIDGQYEDHDFFGKDNKYIYTQVKKDGRWGNIDRNGNIISECIFYTKEDAAYALHQIESGRPLNEWRLPVSNPETNLYGWVDAKGEWAINPQYEDATHFANDTGLFATAKLDGKWASIDNEGYLISKNVFTLSSEAWQAGNEWDTHQELGHWLYPIRDPKNDHWGYVNYKGQWVITPTFEDAKLFIKTWNNRVAPAKQDGKWGCIDHTGQFVVTNIYNTSADAFVAGRNWAEKQKF